MSEKELAELLNANPELSIHGAPDRPTKKEGGATRPSEHDEQVKVFQWAEQNLDKWDGVLAYLFAIPNGGARHPAVAGKLKAEGVKAGVPDIFLPIPAQRYYHGLFIEMKVGKNKRTEKQERWGKFLLRMGYCVKVCYSATEAIYTIREYLGVNHEESY